MAQKQACKTLERLSENDAESMPAKNFTKLAWIMTIATLVTGGVLWSL